MTKDLYTNLFTLIILILVDLQVDHIGGFFTGGDYLDIEIIDTIAFLCNKRGLEIYNLGDPLQPQLLSVTATNGHAEGIDVAGDFAYIADDYNGLCIINILNPTNPIIVGHYYNGGWAKDVKVQNNYAYIADGDSGLVILDITDPINPSYIGQWFQSSYYAVKVFVADSLAYLGCFPKGPLKIINIMDPAHPYCIADYPTNGQGGFDVIWDVNVFDTLALLTGDWTFLNDSIYNFMIINIKNPSIPYFVSGLSFGMAANGIAVQGERAFIGNQNSGVRIIDIANLSTPIEIAHITEVSCAYGLATFDSFLVIPNWYEGFTIFNISDPDLPVLSCYHPNITWTGLVLCDTMPELYIMGFIKNHSILKFVNTEDIMNPYTEAELRFWGDWFVERGKGVCIDYPFLAAGLVRRYPALYLTAIIDLSQRSIIKFTSGTLSGPSEVVSSNIYACDGNNLMIGNLWSNPFWIDSLLLPYPAATAVIKDSFAYIACGAYLAVMNINRDSLLTLSYHGHQNVSLQGGLQINESYLYLNYEGVNAGQYSYDGFMIFDINNPGNPQLVSDTFVTSPLSSIDNVNLTNSCFVYDTLFFLEKDERGFEIWNIRDPAHPVQLLIQDTPGICRHINVKDNIVFVMDERSLEIYQLSETGITSTQGKSESVSTHLSLFPNPFHAATKIIFKNDISKNSRFVIKPITVKIYNSLGQLVKSLNLNHKNANYCVTWDGTDDQNRQLPGGIYFIKANADAGAEMVKAVKLR